MYGGRFTEFVITTGVSIKTLANNGWVAFESFFTGTKIVEISKKKKKSFRTWLRIVVATIDGRNLRGGGKQNFQEETLAPSVVSGFRSICAWDTTSANSSYKGNTAKGCTRTVDTNAAGRRACSHSLRPRALLHGPAGKFSADKTTLRPFLTLPTPHHFSAFLIAKTRNTPPLAGRRGLWDQRGVAAARGRL